MDFRPTLLEMKGHGVSSMAVVYRRRPSEITTDWQEYVFESVGVDIQPQAIGTADDVLFPYGTFQTSQGRRTTQLWEMRIGTADDAPFLQYTWSPMRGARVAVVNLGPATTAAMLQRIWQARPFFDLIAKGDGRPGGTGEFGKPADFLDFVRPVMRTIWTKHKQRPTLRRVSDHLMNAGRNASERSLQRWSRAAGFTTWDVLIAHVLRAD